MEKFDIIVIGAGLGGLSAATYLAKARKKVLVLEHHAVPGGYAHEFRRGKYRFEVALHALDGAAPGGWAYPVLKDLGVLDQVHFHRMDPFYTARFPKHEVTAHADVVKYEAELVKHFPHERKGIHAIIADMIETFWQVRRFGAEGEAGIRPPMEQMPIEYPKMLAAMSMSWDEYMSQFIQDAELKTVISTLWGYYGLPPETLNAAVYIFPWVSYHLMGAYYPEGGSMAMSRAIEATLKKHGGEIRYRQTVNRIEVKDGRAVAVETEKGLRVEADVIISNANAPDTLLKFIGRDHLPAEYVQKIEAGKPSASNLVVYLGLDCDLSAEGWTHHEMFLPASYNIGKDYAAAMKGDFANTGMGLTYYNVADPDCAPAGGSVLGLFALADWNSDNQWGTGGNLENYSNNPQYNEIKFDAANVLIDRAEKLIPNLRTHIQYMEVGTPLTNWKYSRNTNGAIYGTEQSVDNVYMNRLPAKTPIPNLFLTGAWAFAGGMSAAMMSGQETARMVIGYVEGTDVVLMAAPSEQLSVDSNQLTVDGNLLPSANYQPSLSNLSTGLGQSLQLPILKAIGSNREVNLHEIGKPAVLLFHTQETADDAAKVNAAIRADEKYHAAESLLVANIVDLRFIPKLFRGFAEKAMKENYAKAAASLPAEANSADYVLIFPDWDGSTTKAFGLKDTNKILALAVLDSNGNLVGSYQGNDAETHALKLLNQRKR